jgi:hypothetical protein
MHVGPIIEAELEQYYSDEEKLIKKACDLGFSDEQISRIRRVIRETTIKLKTSELAKFYVQKTMEKNSVDTVELDKESINHTVNNRLKRLNDIGVLCCSQTGGERPFSGELIEQIMDAMPKEVEQLLVKENMIDKLKKSLKNYSTEKPGHRNWYLSGLTIKRIL